MYIWLNHISAALKCLIAIARSEDHGYGGWWLLLVGRRKHHVLSRTHVVDEHTQLVDAEDGRVTNDGQQDYSGCSGESTLGFRPVENEVDVGVAVSEEIQ